MTLDYQNVNLEKVFSSITQQTGLTFAYSSTVIDLNNRSVTIHRKNTDLSEVLQILFAGTNINFEVGKNKIYLTQKAVANQVVPDSGKILVSGIVADESGEHLISATIIEKGTSNGTVTRFDGGYTLKVAPDAVLSVSYLGYFPQEVKVDDRKVLNIRLKENSQKLSEVVVTALGLRKKEEALSYSVQEISGADLIRTKNQNWINGLSGKVPNVTIRKNASGLGASSTVNIRGARSISNTNQPLFVIDGMPILNTICDQAYTVIGGTANAGNRDGGDGISNLNPEDIENVTVLKGPAASALYGSQAANGVILVTMKKGKPGVSQINVSSGAFFDRATSLPEFQNSYSYNGSNNWGDKGSMPVYDNLKDFFSTGLSYVNSLSLSTGAENVQAYFSYANTLAEGIIPGNRMNKNSLNVRSTASFFEKKLTVDGTVNLILQDVQNKPVSGGYYMNPLVGLYTFPRGKDMTSYRDGFEVYDENRNMNVQNWYTSVADGFQQNPYWLVNRDLKSDMRERVLASIRAKLRVTEWLSVQARGNADYITDSYKEKIYASTSIALAGENGRYIDMSYKDRLLYGDLMAIIKKRISVVYLNMVLGAAICDTENNILRYDSGTASLYFPNVFTIANIRNNSNAYIDEQLFREQSQSVFGSLQVGYKDMLYLDITGRNQWSSTLAFTESMKTGFFYPSLGTSWIVNHTFTLPEWISFAKFRGAWSKVGNALSPNVSKLFGRIAAGGKVQDVHTASFHDLKPEMSSAWEVGTEWKFFQNRLMVDFSYYHTNTKNQMFILAAPAGESDIKNYIVNSGNVENKGIELSVQAIPVLQNNFTWQLAFNYSRNRNKVLQLHDNLLEYTYGTEGLSSSYSMILRKGDSLGDIYGKGFERDENGDIVYTPEGIPQVGETSNIRKIGNCNPDFMLSLGNSFTYKNLSLYFLIDGNFGGKVLSLTQADLDYSGLSKATGEARDRGYVDLEGRQISGEDNIEKFYLLVGGRSGITEYYMYDATNIRLRELALEYTIPYKAVDKIKFIKNIKLACTAQNLFFLYKKAPFDPEATLSSGNNNQGVDVFGTPLTRSIGFNIKVTL